MFLKRSDHFHRKSTRHLPSNAADETSPASPYILLHILRPTSLSCSSTHYLSTIVGYLRRLLERLQPSRRLDLGFIRRWNRGDGEESIRFTENRSHSQSIELLGSSALNFEVELKLPSNFCHVRGIAASSASNRLALESSFRWKSYSMRALFQTPPTLLYQVCRYRKIRLRQYTRS